MSAVDKYVVGLGANPDRYFICNEVKFAVGVPQFFTIDLFYFLRNIEIVKR